MSISFNTSNTTDYSSLFSSLSTSSSSESSSLLTDWASIKNGSYGKIAKAYYSKQSSTVDSDEAKSTMISNNEIKTGASDIKSAISSLTSSDLYEKKTKTDSDGNTTSDYDYDKIVSALKKFVESYNTIINKADDSDNVGILRNAASIANATTANQNLLSQIGITVGEGNKLTLDEEAVKEANISDIKSLFIGGGSYGSQVDSAAGELINKINAENNKLSSYTSTGSYDNSATIGSIYDGTY